jgi:hypothetical protein
MARLSCILFRLALLLHLAICSTSGQRLFRAGQEGTWPQCNNKA